MSFQENKFPIVLGAVTAVAVGGLAYWGMSSSKKYDTAKSDYTDRVAELKRLTSGPAYPSPENVSAKEKAVSEYRASIDGMQKSFDKFRAPKLENVGVDDFGDALRNAREEFVAKFEKAGTEIPEGSHLGLGVFTRETVDKNDTGVLLYQLGAFKDLFGKLADAKPAKVLNIFRPRLPEETGGKFEPGGKTFRPHTIEVVFTGREESLRQFLASLDDSENYYFVVRSMRVKNEKPVPPNAKDARFEAPKPAAVEEANPFGEGGFVFEDDTEEDSEERTEEGTEEEVVEEEPVEEEPVEAGDSSQILKQVLGDELIQVFMRIDVIQFLEPRPLTKG
ncbi:MAG: Amuc_1100 family pilus-like protein [Verrucomicrobiota bacterium]